MKSTHHVGCKLEALMPGTPDAVYLTVRRPTKQGSFGNLHQFPTIAMWHFSFVFCSPRLALCRSIVLSCAVTRHVLLYSTAIKLGTCSPSQCPPFSHFAIPPSSLEL